MILDLMTIPQKVVPPVLTLGLSQEPYRAATRRGISLQSIDFGSITRKCFAVSGAQFPSFWGIDSSVSGQSPRCGQVVEERRFPGFPDVSRGGEKGVAKGEDFDRCRLHGRAPNATRVAGCD
jgi:hypothetical protein